MAQYQHKLYTFGKFLAATGLAALRVGISGDQNRGRIHQFEQSESSSWR